jgi:hypothetical protein
LLQALSTVPQQSTKAGIVAKQPMGFQQLFRQSFPSLSVIVEKIKPDLTSGIWGRK